MLVRLSVCAAQASNCKTKNVEIPVIRVENPWGGSKLTDVPISPQEVIS